MPSSRTRRAFLSVTVFLATCAIGGSMLNQKVRAQQASDESTVRENLRSFTTVLDTVQQNYAKPLDTETTDTAIYDGAIPGMLRTLDPHSSFYDPKAYAKMREDQHGRYYGVGMTIQAQTNKVVVIVPAEDSPAYKAGIKPGDLIVAVDNKPTANMTSADVANLLKGPKGTPVSVSVTREDHDKPLVFNLIRDEIPRNSVDLEFLIRPGIGYIHINNFQETTGREFADALTNFGDLHGLVLDLRGNPGGLVTEAVSVADKFLRKGQVVASQRGRAFPEQTYRAAHGSSGRDYPVVVLINRGTASAAEIVSGALQDHDRALIVGETSFGKGLVQTVFPISENSGLALTTFHYYTPSGRLIQRNYNGLSLYDYYMAEGKAPKDTASREVKLTDSGRTVYGGGGITPDEPVEPIKSTHIQQVLLQHNVFFDFSKHYLANRTIDRNFQIDEPVLTEFKQYLSQQQVPYTQEELNSVMDWLKATLKSDLFTYEFGQSEGLKIRAEWDPSISKALSYLPEAQTLEDTAKRAMLQKNTARAGETQ